ncbi:death effector domain-containing protein-like, partial [Clarias magur]
MEYKDQVADIEASAHYGDLIEFSYPIGYSHWGVYDGDGHVVHFAVADESQLMQKFRGYLQTMFPVCGDLLLGETRIRRQHLAEVNVPKGAQLLVSNTKHELQPSEYENMKQRLDSLLDKQLPYKLFTQNCEHFATFVRYGKSVCNQSKAGGASQAPYAHDPALISRKSHHPASPSSWRRVMTSQRQRHATRTLPTQNASSSSRSSSSRSGPSHVQASSSSSRSLHTWPEEAVDDAYGLYSLHRMFDIVGTHLTHRDVRVLSFLFVDVIDEYERGGIRNGRDFLLALERQGRCDETNFRHLLQLLRIITRHDLLPYVTLRKRQTVCPDPVDQYLEETSVRYIFPRGSRTESPQITPHRCTGPQPVIRCPSPEVCQPRPKPATPTANRKRKRAHSVVDCREKQTC